MINFRLKRINFRLKSVPLIILKIQKFVKSRHFLCNASWVNKIEAAKIVFGIGKIFHL
jgi:hypothetical protein